MRFNRFCTSLFLILLASEMFAQPSVDIALGYQAELWANVAGGNAQGIRYLDNLDVELSFSHKEWSGSIYGQANNGGSISALVGDIQTLSNIEAENSWRFYECWIGKKMPAIRSSIIFGLMDINGEFDATEAGGLFINSSHGIGPELSGSGILGPSTFPYTGLTLRWRTIPANGLMLQAAVLDGVPADPDRTNATRILLSEEDGILAIAELQIFSPQARFSLDRGLDTDSPYRLIMGAWQYSTQRLGWQGKEQFDKGAYLLMENRFWENGQRSIQGFARLGIANAEINRFSSYYGMGIVYENPTAAMGLSLALPINSSTFIATTGLPTYANEWVIEGTYTRDLTQYCNLQLDMQYIVNPNAAADIKDALVFGLRASFSMP